MTERLPFESAVLFDVLADAAETLHRPGPLEPKYSWAVRAIRVATEARAVAYVDFRPSPRVVASAGTSLDTAQGIIDSEATPLVTQVQRHGRSAHLGRRDDGPIIAVPVPRGAGGVHGVIVAMLDRGAPVAPHHWVAEGIGLHLGVALDNTAMITQLAELEAAQREVVTQLQEAVRPPVPELASVDLGVHYLPADPGAPTGGDLYDWYVLPDGDLHLAVVDAMGKGIPATKDALAVIHALRVLVLEDCPMERLVARADHVLADANPGLAVTVLVARYHPPSGHIRLVGAGHPPALLVSPDDSVEALEAGGIPLGFPEAGSFDLVERTLGRDQSLVMYTDGLIETSLDVIEGLRQLEEAAGSISRYPARFLARSLVERALATARRRDDALALVLRHRVSGRPQRPVLGPFHYRFSPSTAAVPLARHLLSDWLHYQPVDPAYHEDLLFMATELCANAVRASTGAPGSVELRARIDGDGVDLEVEDDGGGYSLDSVDQPTPEAETGRGLFLVSALSDDLEVRRVDSRTVTRCVKRAVVSEG